MRRRSWKDDLPTLALATVAQFGVARGVDWARANRETSELAAHLVDRNFYYAPQILAAVVLLLLVRIVRHILDLRGVTLGEWIRSSALVLVVGVGFFVVAHLDQALHLLARDFGVAAVEPAAATLSRQPFYALLQKTLTLRFGIDLLGLVVCLLALRLGQPGSPEVVAAKQAVRARDWVRAGELYLKAGQVKAAKQTFRKGNAWARLAAIEMREGNAREAAGLYQKSGDSFAWEASRAWEEAGEPGRADKARQAALAAARASSRWDRLAEIAEAIGDHATLAEACRRLAESNPLGPVRSALWKRAGDAARAAGKPLEAAEAYRQAQEFLLSGEQFLEGARPQEAARDFERSGALSKAAIAAAAAGNEPAAAELLGREAEAKGDLLTAAGAYRRAGQPLRAAGLFEKAGDHAQAAETWKEAGRLDRAASLYQRAGRLDKAAEAFEAGGLAEQAASLYRELKQYDKAAALFRVAGRLPASAAALQAAGRFNEAAALFHRVGRTLEAARCALLAGRREQTWEYLIAVPRAEPEAGDVFHQLALAHLKANEPKDAVHVLHEYLGRLPVDADNLPLHMTLLRALREAGDSSEGMELGRIAAFDPAVLEGATVAPVSPSEWFPEERAMPPALARTPTMVHRSGHHAIAAPAGPPRLAPLAQPGATTPVAMPASPLSRPVPPAPAGFTGLERPESRYEIVAEVGRGGMGVVHKALDKKLDRFVALKILPWQLRGDETAMRYFKREAKAIAALKHPNIVALYDYGEGFGSLYLAMEYLEGPNLQKLLKKEPEKIRKNWRNWFVQATRGVAAAHAKGLLHRDLKPANLILDEHETLRILDFGLALPEGEAGGTSKLIGSPAFFPPEVLRGEMPSPASDVYSLGAAFYTLATGRWPYIGDDVLVARLERDPDDPRPYAPFLSEDEIEILMKTLARHRPDRYPDAGELLGALLALEA